MPDIRITEPQELRFDSLREELEEIHVDQYGTIRDQDVVAYLLDLADAVEDPDRSAGQGAAIAGEKSDGEEVDEREDDVDTGEETDESDERAENEETDEEGDEGEDDADGGDDADGDEGEDDADGGDDESRLNAMMSLLDTHADKWRESDGEARYEVDLPDGEAATAQTKDDVRALLFKNY